MQKQTAQTSEADELAVVQRIENANTLAEMLGIASVDALKRGLSILPLSEAAAAETIENYSRRFRPWPEWALRLTVEVFIVHFPRVRRSAAISCLKGLHWFLFEAQSTGLRLPDRSSTYHRT